MLNAFIKLHDYDPSIQLTSLTILLAESSPTICNLAFSFSFPIRFFSQMNLSTSSAYFEGLDIKFEDIINSETYLNLCNDLSEKTNIYVLGNGGLHFVAGHMACDISRLVAHKTVISCDSVGFVTSNANDYGFSEMFCRWLDTTVQPRDYSNCMIIGLSCSGRSDNIVKALEWGNSHNIKSWMITGSYVSDNFLTLGLNCTYYHTVEVLVTMLFYDMIHKIGSDCPNIEANYADSISRKKVTNL